MSNKKLEIPINYLIDKIDDKILDNENDMIEETLLVNSIDMIDIVNCGSSRQKLCINERCKQCFEKSFAADYEKSKFWAAENPLRPRDVFKKSNKEYKFNCDKCKKVFEICLNKVTTKNLWCPCCSKLAMCKNKLCELCLEKTFASHKYAKFWSSENLLTPREVAKGSHQIFKFHCDVCKHTFEKSLTIISDRGQFCSFCDGLKLCEDEKCNFCWNKSFASNNKLNIGLLKIL